MTKEKQNNVGKILFAFGAVTAIASGFIYPGGLNVLLSGVLITLGALVGLLNVTQKETTRFLLAAVTLVIITSLWGPVAAKIPVFGLYIEGMLLSVLTFLAPVGIIVAFKEVYHLAEN